MAIIQERDHNGCGNARVWILQGLWQLQAITQYNEVRLQIVLLFHRKFHILHGEVRLLHYPIHNPVFLNDSHGLDGEDRTEAELDWKVSVCLFVLFGLSCHAVQNRSVFVRVVDEFVRDLTALASNACVRFIVAWF